MSEKRKKRFFASHAKSSAAAISLVFHLIFLLIALSFVAVSVITKQDQSFEVKKVSRPNVPLKKLEVPVNIEKKRKPKPKLRKRLVVKPKLDRNLPDIKLPEVTGVKGGIGSGVGDGLGGGGIGFGMPEIEIFGVKGRGEKVFIILDSTPHMMVDEMGGIPSYTLIKDELVRILGNLHSAVLFNIAVYEIGSSRVLFPNMVTATDAHVAKVKEWLDPLNAVSTGMGDRDYGVRTLGRVEGSRGIGGNFKAGKLQMQREWVAPLMLSMLEQADAVFLLSHGWGTLWHNVDEAASWPESKWVRWRQAVADSRKRHTEENAERRSRGQPPRVHKHQRAMVRAYYPNVEQPPVPRRYHYTPKDLVAAMELNRKKNSKRSAPATSGINRDKKDKYTVNIIHFIRKSGASQRDAGRFKELSRACGGDYRTLAGFDAIKSAASVE